MCIGKRNSRSRAPRARQHDPNANNNNERSGLDDGDHVGCDVGACSPAQQDDWNTHDEGGVID